MWLFLPVDVQALLSRLDVLCDVHFARPDVAESALFDHLTLLVVVSNA